MGKKQAKRPEPKMRTRTKTKKTVFGIINTVLALFFGAFVALPFVWMFICSMYGTSAEIFQIPLRLPRGLHFENYGAILKQIEVLRLLGNTFEILLFNVIVGTLSSVLVAYGFARFNAKGKGICFSILLSTVMLPWVVTMVPAYIIWSKVGLIGTKWPLMLPSIGGGAFNVFMLVQFYRGIPRSLDEAAIIDGCSRVGILFRIILPNCVPILVTILVFSFNGQWSDYIGPSLYLKDTAQYTLSLGLLQAKSSMFTAPRWNEIMAGCVLFSLPSIAVYAFSQKAFTNGIVMTGIKE